MKEAKEGQTQAPGPPEEAKEGPSTILERSPHLASFLLLDDRVSFHVAMNKCVKPEGSPTLPRKDPDPREDAEFKVAESEREALF